MRTTDNPRHLFWSFQIYGRWNSASGLKRSLSSNLWLLRNANHVETHRFFGKEKFWAQWSLNKLTLTVLWNMKRLMPIDFLEKEVIENSASHWQHLKAQFTLFLELPSYIRLILIRSNILIFWNIFFLLEDATFHVKWTNSLSLKAYLWYYTSPVIINIF